MKFIIDNWMLISVAVASGGMLLWPVVQGASGGSLTAAGAVQLINREKGVLIDVCEPDEYAQGHAAGARNVPLSQFEAKLGEAVKNKTLPLILICRTGSRSGRAVALAQKLGYANAQSLGGGLAGWKNANLPVEKA